MALILFYLVVGLVLLLVASNYLTDGAVALAKKLKVSELFIGLTVVAVGTSMPELVVSSLASLQGKSDVAIGNIVGSNIFNILFILGMVVLVKPITLTKEDVKRDFPICLLVSVLLAFLALDSVYSSRTDMLSRFDGILFLVLYIAYVAFCYHQGKKNLTTQQIKDNTTEAIEDVIEDKITTKWPLIIVMIAGGLIGLVIGSRLFINGAMGLAHYLGVSETTIALIVMAGGTSVPELATSLTSALKGHTSIAVGNVVGSNIANILLILGICSTITPLSLGEITYVDISLAIFAVLLLIMSCFTFTKHKVDRLEGLMFLIVYAFYVMYLVVK